MSVDPTSGGPLDGLLVVAIEQAVAAPFASRQLADLGARVIKVERRDGGDFARDYDRAADGMSSFFVWLNRGKESITADLKDDEDRALVSELIGRADVFVQNLAPGAAARLGLDATALAAAHPRLIACDLSGYGGGGPYERRKAYDLLIQCEAGLVSITGSEREPAKVGVSIADISGGMYAYSGILTALYERERTGRGAALAVSLFDGLSEWMSQPALYGHYSGADPRRNGAAHASIAPYGPYATGDGEEVNLGVQNGREWRILCDEIAGRPELADDPRFATNSDRVANRAALDAELRPAIARLRAAELIERLEAAGIAFGVMRSAGALLDHPQHRARDRWTTVETPVGPLAALKPPVVVGGREPRLGAVPALGEHDAAIRAWLAGERV
ncbi:CoA transferase [Conexibacter arvalis]|uniref:Crotonobetainyl-CoA:carnitine CoA-transferase CaiB-like acyl-CoA transferase n=1 Tax=Conexibacter arvalis TaxID=912552 RepID=A0A840IJG0_9ACTN|nr:crotonobetainyl-CoA:carnitine CoA-transferase CaiB-like acyl-CoA transferase [Conexibacter arvalis]